MFIGVSVKEVCEYWCVCFSLHHRFSEEESKRNKTKTLEGVEGEGQKKPLWTAVIRIYVRELDAGS